MEILGLELAPTFLLKFGLCFLLFVILPVWVLRIMDISFFYKIAFTFVGSIGILIALSGKTINLHRNR